MIHLVHPATVHFTIAFLLAGSVAEAFGIFAGRERVERWGGACVLLGTACVVLSVVTGFLAENSIAHPAGASADIERHERLGMITLALYLVALFWKGWDRGRVRESARPMYAVFVLAAAVLVCVTAWVGGELVYVHGAGVGPQP
jgi:uncharacterized membrane protein